LLVSSLFASLSWGSNPIRFSGNSSFASALVLLCQKNLNWAELLFPFALHFITWSLTWLPQCKVGGKSSFISKIRKTPPLTNTTLLLLMPTKNSRSWPRGILLPQKLRWKTSSPC
jgi:hypothetical protein